MLSRTNLLRPRRERMEGSLCAFMGCPSAVGLPAAVMLGPPNIRASAASSRPQDTDREAPPVNVDALVAAFVDHLHRSGLLPPPPPAEAGEAAATAAAVPAVLGATAAPLFAVKTEDTAGDLLALLSDSNSSGWRTSDSSSMQCGQIQKIGWESKPNRENLYILQK